MRFASRLIINKEIIKNLLRISFYFWKKCWPQIFTFITLIMISYLFIGMIGALISFILGLYIFIHKMTDWFLYHPNEPIDSRTNVCSPKILDLPFESTYISTSDGILINVFLLKQKPELLVTAPTIIYFHGNAGNIGHRLLNASELYHTLECNILLVEYRGFGHSQGTPSEAGIYKDAEAAINYLLSLSGIAKDKIILFGRSLGGAVAIHLAQHSQLSQKISAIIVENTFTSIPEVAKLLFNCKLVKFIPKWVYKSKYDSLSKIKSIKVPILFLSGLDDELIPPIMMHTLFELASSDVKHIQHFEGGTHNFTWRCSNYYSIIDAFLIKVLNNNKSSEKIISKADLIWSQTVPQIFTFSDCKDSYIILNNEQETDQ